MKRVAFYLLWTLAFWMFALMLGGQIAKITHSVTLSAERHAGSFRESLDVGFQSGLASSHAGFIFMRDYWRVTLAGAAVAAGLGAVTGVLPGARKLKISEPPPLPPR